MAKGDQKAFTQLVDENWNRVYSHALAYTKSSPRAQEITQDVFLKLWNQRERLTEVEDFTSYLFILGKNQIISSLRKKLEEYSSENILDAPEDLLLPDRQLEFKEAHQKVMEAIEQMPPARKTVFKLSRLEGKTYEEIAKELGISKNTVKEHIILALSFLRTYVHTHGDLLMLVVFIWIYS